jgi:hypothetical protein
MKMIPQADHLRVELSAISEAESNWFSKDTLVRVEVYNGVPVIIFVCQDAADSFFLHLNTAELSQQEPTTWLDTDKLKLNFVFLNYQDRIVKEQEVSIYEGGTKKIKDAFLLQQGLSADQIEDSVDPLYQTDHSKIDWLKFPK